MSIPDEYLIGHIREAIARDVGELGVDVRLAAGKVFLSGVVPSRETSEQIAEVVAREAPGFEIHNATTVRSAVETEEVEPIG
jgi:osmotically-inducible protein OsmY